MPICIQKARQKETMRKIVNNNNSLIYQERFLKWESLIPLLALVFLFLIYWINPEENNWAVVYLFLFLILTLAGNRRKKPAFTVYDDRIDLLKPFSNKLASSIRIDQIDQVRFEDEFSNSFWADYIIIYLKPKGEEERMKQDQFSLEVTGFNRKASVLKLLQFFQSKNLEVVIKTKSKKIKEETGLENWDLS
jgi:hypothetical protein